MEYITKEVLDKVDFSDIFGMDKTYYFDMNKFYGLLADLKATKEKMSYEFAIQEIVNRAVELKNNNIDEIIDIITKEISEKDV
jgi:hypothetical protein